jgi:hypothetical protein
MRRLAAFILAAAALAAAGYACLGVARLEGHMADAQERAATQQFDAAQESLAGAEPYVRMGRWVPFIGRDARQELTARAAALQYWQRQYDAVLPAQAEPVAAVDEANADLRLVVANALHRRGQALSTDKANAVQALDEAAAGYLTVLRGENWTEDAAYNYEYVIRLRDALGKGTMPPSQRPPNTDLGQGGSPAQEAGQQKFEIYVPLQGNEKAPSAGDAGKTAAKDRKG